MTEEDFQRLLERIDERNEARFEARFEKIDASLLSFHCEYHAAGICIC